MDVIANRQRPDAAHPPGFYLKRPPGPGADPRSSRVERTYLNGEVSETHRWFKLSSTRGRHVLISRQWQLTTVGVQ